MPLDDIDYLGKCLPFVCCCAIDLLMNDVWMYSYHDSVIRVSVTRTSILHQIF